MKKIFSSILFTIFAFSVSFAYSPTTQDQQLISLIEVKIDELSLVQAAQISGIVSWALERFESGTRKYWFAESIVQYLDNGILQTPEMVQEPMVQFTWPSVANGNMIAVNYVWSLTDGAVFDTSLEDVARDSNLYNPVRPYQPLEFEVGAGQMIAGFDSGVLGMRVGETKTLIIPPENAYGFWDHFLAGETLEFVVTLVEVK